MDMRVKFGTGLDASKNVYSRISKLTQSFQPRSFVSHGQNSMDNRIFIDPIAWSKIKGVFSICAHVKISD